MNNTQAAVKEGLFLYGRVSDEGYNLGVINI